MAIITIPKQITKGEELVVIPRKIYERFLFKVELDRDLKKALEDVKKVGLLDLFLPQKKQ